LHLRFWKYTLALRWSNTIQISQIIYRFGDTVTVSLKDLHHFVKSKKIFVILAKYPFGCHKWAAVPISAALRQDPHIKVTTVASRWQCVEDLIGLEFETHTSRTRSERLTTCAIWAVTSLETSERKGQSRITSWLSLIFFPQFLWNLLYFICCILLKSKNQKKLIDVLKYFYLY